MCCGMFNAFVSTLKIIPQKEQKVVKNVTKDMPPAFLKVNRFKK